MQTLRQAALALAFTAGCATNEAPITQLKMAEVTIPETGEVVTIETSLLREDILAQLSESDIQTTEASE